MSSAGRARARGSAAAPTPRACLLHVFTLTGFTVAQPLYELLGRFAPFLAAHSSSAADVVLLTVVLSLAVPLAVAAPARILARFAPRAGWWAQIATVAVLVTVLAMHLSRLRPLLARFDVAGPLALGALAGWLYARWPPAWRVLSLLALASAAFPLIFLALSPVRSLLAPERPSAPPVFESAAGPVVLLVFDELPLLSLLDAGERIDAERFPDIAALAAEGVWYRNTTTVAQTTSYAVPAILSGRYPFAEGLAPTVRDYPTNLFTLLGGAYALNVFETGTGLCPLELCAGAAARPPLASRLPRLLADTGALYLHLVTPRSLASRLPNIGDGWRGFWRPRGERRWRPLGADEGRPRRFRWYHPRETLDEFLLAIDERPRRTLHYLHVLLPHTPWRYLPDGHAFEAVAPPGGTGRVWTGTPWQIAQGLQRHLLQVGFVDRFVGAVRRELEKAGLWEESLVILVADHGFGFRAGESTRFLTPAPGRNLSDLANVPLIVKYPGGERRGIDDRYAETVDLLPTVLDVLGVTAPPELDGRSLAGPDPRRRTQRIYRTRGERSRRGPPVHFAPQRLAERHEAVRFKVAQLGVGSWDRVFAMGPHGSLVGSDAAEVTGAAEGFELDRPDSYRDVDPELETLPLWVSGSLQAPELAGRWVAVVVNDRVAAVTKTYAVDGRERLAALVAPSSLRRGANSVEVRPLARDRF